MSSESNSSVIHKKARHAREDFDARAMSPSKALRLSLEKCGDRIFGLALTVCAVEQRGLVHAALKQEPAADCLILLLDGQGGARGAALVDRQLAQALVEVQTMGRVRPGAADERPLTGTDAAIVAPLIDAMCDGFDEKMAEAQDHYRPARFRFGDRVADMRGLMLALEAPDFELLRLTVDVSSGARTGVLTVILPREAVAQPDPGAADGGPDDRFDLGELAMTAPVSLDAVLERIELPLAQICQLTPGMTLPIGAGAIGRTELVAAKGHVAARGRLGRINGFRAVRLQGDGMVEAAGLNAPSAREEPRAPPSPAELPNSEGDGTRPKEGAASDPTGAAGPDTAALLSSDAAGEGGPPDLPDRPVLEDAP